MKSRLLQLALVGFAFTLFVASPVLGQAFEDVAPELGLNFIGACGGAFWFDYDLDGDLDLLRTERFSGQDVIFRNDGDHFTEMSDIGLASGVDHGTTLPMDFDHDGDYDIWIDGYNTPIQLMVNENGHYTDQTVELGLQPNQGGRHGTWLDINHDGWMDLMIELVSGWKLYRNDQGEFADITSSTELPNLHDGSFFSETDIDLDGDVDIFMTRIDGSDHLYVNLGNGSFEDATIASGLSGIPAELGCLWVDFDHDKYPDLLTQGINDHAIWHNDGDGTFTEMTVHGTNTDFDGGGWPYGARYAAADFDMDGDADFYVCRPGGCGDGLAPNQFFRMDSIDGLDIWFTDIAPELSMDFLQDGYPWVADYDQDGDMDLYIAQQNSPDRLFRNNLANSANRLQVELLGPAGERDRWHTRVEVSPHDSNIPIAVSELNFSNVNRNGFNSYLVLDESAHYDLRLYFACGVVMTPEEYPQLSDIVPAEIGHIITVQMGEQVAVGGLPPVPSQLTILNSYPNPFNGLTTFSFQVPKAGPVKLSIFTLEGKLVDVMNVSALSEQETRVTWNADKLSSGLYIAALEAGSYRARTKVLLLK